MNLQEMGVAFSNSVRGSDNPCFISVIQTSKWVLNDALVLCEHTSIEYTHLDLKITWDPSEYSM